MGGDAVGAPSLAIGLTTSIGTLPHDRARDAVDFVLRRQPGLPAVPQLPNRSPLERRLAQAAWGIPGVRVRTDGSLELSSARLEPDAPFSDPGFAGAPFRTLHTFLDHIVDRAGPAKFQLTGPVTLGLALHSAGVDRQGAFAAAGTVVRSRAKALLSLVADRAPAVEPVVFVDEPGLRSCLDPGFPLPAEAAIDLVSSVLATLEPMAVTGLRCTGAARRPGAGTSPVDWPLVLQSGPQILAVPVHEREALVAAAPALDRFLERGGRVAWGAVPTEGPVGSMAGPLWRVLSGIWCDLVRAGCDVARLRTQALLTPAGGLGRHQVSQVGAVFDLVDELALRLYDQATGIRLSVGA